MRLAKLSDLGDGGGNRRDPGTIYQESSPGSQAGGVRASPVLKGNGGEARGPDGRDQLPGRYGIRGVNSGCADLEEVGLCGGRTNQVLGAVVLSREMSARVPGQSKTYRDSGNSGHKMELHSDGNRRQRRNIGERFRDGT